MRQGLITWFPFPFCSTCLHISGLAVRSCNFCMYSPSPQKASRYHFGFGLSTFFGIVQHQSETQTRMSNTIGALRARFIPSRATTTIRCDPAIDKPKPALLELPFNSPANQREQQKHSYPCCLSQKFTRPVIVDRHLRRDAPPLATSSENLDRRLMRCRSQSPFAIRNVRRQSLDSYIVYMVAGEQV